jgi:hypothetical protein
MISMAQLAGLLVKYICLKIFTIEIFFHALEKGHYKCWIKPTTNLPMIYIDDCIEATVS